MIRQNFFFNRLDTTSTNKCISSFALSLPFGIGNGFSRDVGRILEKPVNHEAKMCNLQAFIEFSHHPAWFYHVIKPRKMLAIAEIIFIYV